MRRPLLSPLVKLPLLWLPLLAMLLVAAPLTSSADEPDDAGKIMDLSYENVPITKVLAEIARLSGQNIVVASDVAGEVTLKLQKIHWKKALDAIAKAKNLVVTYEDGITRVRSAAPSLRYAKLLDGRRVVSKFKYDTSKFKPAKDTELEKRRRLEAEHAEAEAKIRALEQRLDKVAAGSHASRRDEARLQFELAALRKSAASNSGKASNYLKVYDVRYIPRGNKTLQRALKRIDHDGAQVTDNGGRITVHATLAQHKLLTDVLANIRGGSDRHKAAANALDLLRHEQPAPPRKQPRKAGKIDFVDAKTGELKARLSDVAAKGSFKVSSWNPVGPESKAVKELRQRLLDLKQAAKHLAAAGAKRDVLRIRGSIAETERKLVEVRRAESAARALELRTVRGKMRVHAHPSAKDQEALGSSIQALRGDVRALRGEVRELTELVRQLVKARR